MHYYKHHIGDFNSGTVRMTQLERWFYRDLIELYYDTEKPLPKDLDRLSAMVGARTQEHREAIAAILINKFESTDEGWFHARCEAELASYRKRGEANRTNGARGGRRKSSDTNPPETHSVTNESETEPKRTLTTNHKPLTINQEPITTNQSPIGDRKTKPQAAATLPDWLDAEVWSAFVEHRKKLRKPMTAHAESLMVKKLAALVAQGCDPTERLETAIERGWLSVYPLDGNGGAVGRKTGFPATLDQIEADAEAQLRRIYGDDGVIDG